MRVELGGCIRTESAAERRTMSLSIRATRSTGVGGGLNGPVEPTKEPAHSLDWLELVFSLRMLHRTS